MDNSVIIRRENSIGINCAGNLDLNKGKLPTQFPKRYDLTDIAIYVEFAINPYHTLLIQAWEAHDTFQRNRSNLIPQIESTI